MTFATAPWASRVGSLGDEAESAYETVAQSLGWKYVRFGLSRPPLHVASLPKRLRYTPDYLESHRFVEVQGGGQDRVVKIKVEKWNEVSEWNKIHPVSWFLWNRKIGLYAMPTHEDVADVIARRRYTTTTFDEHKVVYVISNGEFSWKAFPDGS